MESNLNDTRMASCPRFISCNVPLCPLDIFQAKRVKDSDDEICTLPKSYRLKLGKGLPMCGLKANEYKAIIHYYGSLEAYISKKPLIPTDKIQKPSIDTFSEVQIQNNREAAKSC